MKRLAVEGLTAVGKYGIGSRTINKLFDDLMFTYLFFILEIHKFCMIINITYNFHIVILQFLLTYGKLFTQCTRTELCIDLARVA